MLYIRAMQLFKSILNYQNILKNGFMPWICLCVMWGFDGQIFADDYYWNATSGNTSSSSNWYNSLLPSSSSTTRIFFNTSPALTTATSAYHDAAGSLSVNSLVFGGSNNFTLSGNSFSFAGLSPSIVNNNSVGSVFIVN